MFNRIKRNLYDRIREQVVQELREKRSADKNCLPITKLEHKHFDNINYILDRQELLTLMPKLAVCAEIGVANGDFSRNIIDITNPKKLHLIDAWDTDRYGEALMTNVANALSSEIDCGSVQIDRGMSTEILKTFSDNYFDWVYIDTSHSYWTTRDELKICRDKVKPEGIIAGHDYCMGNWITGYKYGVIEAVYEFCTNHDWEIIYITSDIISPSFALRRIRKN